MRLLKLCPFLMILLLSLDLFSQEILINQVGYELTGTKIAVIQSTEISDYYDTFIVTDEDGDEVYSGTVENIGAVDGWSGRYFHTVDFTDFQEEGTYQIQVDTLESYEFTVKENLLFTETSASLISFFNNMRYPETEDTEIPFYGDRTGTVDVHGGWFDATGDPGKHMSHLSFGNYTNPQQIPMVAWAMMESYILDSAGFDAINAELIDEIKWGCDYLMRNHDSDSYFYLSVFDDWGGSSTRQICEWGQEGSDSERTDNYQCAYREGGGIAIAALAKAYTLGLDGDDFTKEEMLAIAEASFTHLEENNTSYCNNGEENIIDDYCALLAAVELYKATGTASYLTAASTRADNIMNRQQTDGWFAADDDANRPFFHAADEGLPIVALVKYEEIDSSKDTEIATTLTNWLGWYKTISNEVTNPFDYVREYNKPYDASANTYGSAQTTFFIPHDNETEYWWQGENARLASMTTALIYASKTLSDDYSFGTDDYSTMAIAQLDWILGKNPFDVCMMHGFGESNTFSYKNGDTYTTNYEGGICNGITSMDDDENDIDFAPYDASDWENWRWVEQWLPHDLWFLLAVSSVSNSIKSSSSYIEPPVVTITSPDTDETYSVGDTIMITATASDENYTITQVELFAGSTSLGVFTEEPYTAEWEIIMGGDLNISAVATSSAGKSTTATITVEVEGQGPYEGVVHQIPGDVIEAEDFDAGGNGVAYYDTGEGNGSDLYRDGEDVHIESCEDGGYDVGYIAASEWLEYTVNIAEAGDYDFILSYACWGTTEFVLEIDDVAVTDTITPTQTGGYQVWDDFTISDVTLPEGIHVLKIYFISANINFNSITTESKIPDCNGDIAGSAYYDDCGYCVEGNTGLTACATQSLTIPQGISLFSINIAPDDTLIENIFGTDLEYVEEIMTLSDYYKPNDGSSTLSYIETGVGYIIKTTQEITLSLTGIEPALPVDYTLPEGWTIVGVPVSASRTVETYFSSIWDYMEEVKDFESFYNPSCAEELLKLNTIEPGKAYLVKVSTDTEMSIK